MAAPHRLPRRLGVPRGRHVYGVAAVLAALLLLGLPSSALAAPRATSVSGFYGAGGEFSDYVTLRVETEDASAVFLEWPNHGGACATTGRRTGCFASRRSSIATVDFSFRNCRGYRSGGCVGPVTRFRVRVEACRRGRCRSRTFRGTFQRPSG